MENKSKDEVAGAAKWRILVRQQSEKIGRLADNVVLPKNVRITRRVSKLPEVEMQSVETQLPQINAVAEEELTKKKTEYFPIFMIAISIIQIILFYSCDEHLLTITLGYDPHRRHEIWRFITVMLVHSGYSHLWGNLVMQLVLGVFIEIVHQWKRIAIIYLASVFGGSLFVTVLGNTTYSVGSSSGVMGLLFSHLATITLNWNEMDRKFSRLFCVSMYIAYDIGTDVYNKLVVGEEPNTSHAGHLGGAITGFLVSILVLKNFEKHPWEETLQKICVGILIAIFVTVLAINVTAWDYFPITEWNFVYDKTQKEEAFDNVTDSESTELYDESVDLYDDEYYNAD